jgi:hypothetical protein
MKRKNKSVTMKSQMALQIISKSNLEEEDSKNPIFTEQSKIDNYVNES